MAINVSLDPTTMADCTGEVGEPATRCNQEFTHQIKLVPVNGDSVDVNGIPWSFHFESQEFNKQGKTGVDGKTERVNTPQPETFFALVGKLAESYRRRGDISVP